MITLLMVLAVIVIISLMVFLCRRVVDRWNNYDEFLPLWLIIFFGLCSLVGVVAWGCISLSEMEPKDPKIAAENAELVNVHTIEERQLDYRYTNPIWLDFRDVSNEDVPVYMHYKVESLHIEDRDGTTLEIWKYPGGQEFWGWPWTAGDELRAVLK